MEPSIVGIGIDSAAGEPRRARLGPPQSITGVVLAGTHHTHHSPLESLGPRPLLPVAGRPLLMYALDWLGDPNVANVVVCSNGGSHALKDALARADSRTPALFRDDVPARGPAGSAADVAAGCRTGLVVVVDCSTIPDISLSALIAAHQNARATATIVVQPRSSRGQAAGTETPVGIYVFDRQAFAHVADFGFHDIKEGLLPQLVRAGQSIELYRAPRTCPRVLDTRSYLQVGLWAVERACFEPTATPVHPCSRIGARARLIGPVIVSDGAEIRDGATIVGPVFLGAGSVVGAGAVVSRTLVGNDSVIGEHALVDGSLLLDNAVVDDHTRLSETLQRPSPRWSSLHAAARGGAESLGERLEYLSGVPMKG